MNWHDVTCQVTIFVVAAFCMGLAILNHIALRLVRKTLATIDMLMKALKDQQTVMNKLFELFKEQISDK